MVGSVPTNTGTHPKLLWPGVHAIWGQIYMAHATEYTDLWDIEDSGVGLGDAGSGHWLW